MFIVVISDVSVYTVIVGQHESGTKNNILVSDHITKFENPYMEGQTTQWKTSNSLSTKTRRTK